MLLNEYKIFTDVMMLLNAGFVSTLRRNSNNTSNFFQRFYATMHRVGQIPTLPCINQGRGCTLQNGDKDGIVVWFSMYLQT